MSLPTLTRELYAALVAWEKWYSSDSSEHARDDAREAGLKAMRLVDGHSWRYDRKWPHCITCGLIKRADGINKPCNGPVKIGVRTPTDHCLTCDTKLLDREEIIGYCPACEPCVRCDQKPRLLSDKRCHRCYGRLCDWVCEEWHLEKGCEQ